MLQKLNERIQGVFAWTIIIIIAATFTLFGLDYYRQGRHAGDAKAQINDEEISSQSFEVSYRRARAQQEDSLLTAAMEKKLRKEVLDGLIQNKIAVQSAEKAGFAVGSQQVDAAIVSIPQFKENGNFSPERFQQALSAALFTPQSFRQELKQGMLLNQQRFAFLGTDFALPNEIKQFLRLFLQKRSYSYLEIPYQTFAEQVQISNEQIKAYYQNHKNDFMTEESVSIKYVLLDMQTIKNKIKIPEDTLKQYFEENQQNFLTPASWQLSHIFIAVPKNASKKQWLEAKNKANHIADQLKADPSQFLALLKQYTDDKLSIGQKGKLPEVSAGQTAVDESLMTLTKTGDISGAVKTKKGYEIFKVDAYQPAKKKSFKEVKDVIKDQLTSDQANQTYSRALEKISELSFENPDSLDPVAQELNLDIKETKPFTRKGGDSQLTRNKKILTTAFTDEIIQAENNSEPVQLDSDKVLVFRVKEHFSPKQKPLEAVQTQIKQLLTLEESAKKATALAKQLQNSKKPQREQLLKELNVQWIEVADASRDSASASQNINDLAFAMNKVGAIESTTLADNKSMVIVRLNAIKEGEMKELNSELKQSIAQQIKANYGMTSYQLFQDALLKEADIKRF